MGVAMPRSKADLDFEQYGANKNCFINKKAKKLLDSKEKESVVCRYMPYVRLEEWIGKSILTFVSPNKWEDPFEKIYLGTTIKNLPQQEIYKPRSIACLCFTKSSFRNSVAFWNTYKSSDFAQLVRVEFDFKQMIDHLMKSIKDNKMDVNVYISAVDYSLNQEFIKNKEDFIKSIMERSTQNNGVSLYIKMLLHKRKAFAFENEIRVFIVPQNDVDIFDEKNVCVVKNFNYNSVIKKIWLEPIRLPPGWVTEDFAQERFKRMKIKIRQSLLYEKCPKCKVVDLHDLNKGENICS